MMPVTSSSLRSVFARLNDILPYLFACKATFSGTLHFSLLSLYTHKLYLKRVTTQDTYGNVLPSISYYVTD